MATDIIDNWKGSRDLMREELDRKRGLEAIEKLRLVLSKFTYAGSNEAQVQTQVIQALGMAKAFGAEVEVVGSEVINDAGRWDVLVNVGVGSTAVRVVLELKVRGTAAAAESQAQRYAGVVGVDAVAIVTTSNRLLRDIATGQDVAVNQTLGGKPFGAIYLRPF